MSCTNNLKQMAIGWHNSHDVLGRFPKVYLQDFPNKSLTTDVVQLSGWRVGVLPYIEQTALFDAYTAFAAINTNNNIWSEAVGMPWLVNIPSFLCPSDPNSNRSRPIGGANYYGNRGDLYVSHTFPDGSSGQISSPLRGSLTRDGANMRDIIDGTSNTLMLMEVAGGVGNSNQVKTGVVLKGASSQFTRYFNMNPKACYDLKTGTTLGTVAPANLAPNAYGSEPHSLPCLRWHDCRTLFSQCFAILPPNSPHCATNGDDYRVDVLMSASSYHFGGANCAMMDGSVRFVSDMVDWGTDGRSTKDAGLVSGNSHTYSGISLYGVWGAAGSANGVETKSL